MLLSTLTASAIGASSACLAFCLMEPWSLWVHRVVWHGPLWSIHQTHHPDPAAPTGGLQANDAFAVAHAVPAVALLVGGLWHGTGPEGPTLLAAIAAGAGVGISAFGLAYSLVHDGIIHERLPWVPALTRHSAWLRAVKAAHLAHHRRDHGAPYGLFFGRAELLAEARRRRAPSQAMSRRVEALPQHGHAEHADGS